MREFDILDEPFAKKYSHPAIQWYQKKHLYLVDGGSHENFDLLPPAKNIEEAFEYTKLKSQKAAKDFMKEASPMIAEAKERGQKMSDAISDFEMKTFAQQAKEKYDNFNFK